ncbi:MAG: hypothetical protein JG766_415 [Desulfacinum sp.]|jgi:hypothetical protein|nr:hypothetical protein [Desulfacinum sp.]
MPEGGMIRPYASRLALFLRLSDVALIVGSLWGAAVIRCHGTP